MATEAKAGDLLLVSELFYSIQGESTWAGLPCLFVRLSGCNLRCNYCDARYTWEEPEQTMALVAIIDWLRQWPGVMVEITGGEPLLQPPSLELMAALCDRGKTVLLETNGANDIAPVDPRVIRIVDLKPPSSSESHRNRWENLACLRDADELKFVIATREDFEWARDRVREHRLERKLRAIHFSPVQRPEGGLSPQTLAEWILAEKLPVRLQLQLHKILWPAAKRGV